MSNAQASGLYYARKRNRAAVLAPELSAQASGSITFAVNPSNAATITIGGTVVTFGFGVTIGAGRAATLVNLLAFLRASNDTNLVKATYGVTGNVLAVRAKARGVETLTLAASAATVSHGTVKLPQIKQRVTL
jgi:hypothetical protein